MIFAEAFEAFAQAALQHSGRIRIKSHQIPQRLAAVFAQIGERVSVGVGMASDVFAGGAVRMAAELLQSFRIRKFLRWSGDAR